MTETKRPNVIYGDITIARQNSILLTTVGSQVHGIAIEGTDDDDQMGVFIEPMEHVIGLAGAMDTVVYRDKPEGVRSQPGDLDLNYYALRKYLNLALKGNPTVLLPLWCPQESIVAMTAVGAELRRLRDAFISQHAVHRFLAYLESQHAAMMGVGKRGSMPHRPELIEQYGYDTKYAAHALRLAYQGWEIARQGTLTLPLPDKERKAVLEVKQGKYSRQIVSREIQEIRRRTEAALAVTRIPEDADRAAIGEFSIDAHIGHWRRKR